MHRLTHLPSIFILSLLLSCVSAPGHRLEYVFPDNFQGIAIVRPNQPKGVPITENNGVVTLRFPNSGILEVTEADPIHEWHQAVARYENGVEIPVADANTHDDTIALRLVGSKGEENNGEETWYVVGKQEDMKKARIKMIGFEYQVGEELTK